MLEREQDARPALVVTRARGAVVPARDTPEEREPETDRRGAILRAVGSAAEQLLGDSPWQQRIEPVLAELGEAMGVSRAYVFRNVENESGELTMDMCFEWVAAGISMTTDDPSNHGWPYLPAYTHYINDLSSNEVMTMDVSGATGADLEDLLDEDILSTAFLPVFDGDHWWGYLGFDDCRIEREWSEAELDALRAASATLGAAIRMERVSRASRAVEERYRRLVEQIPTVIYIDEVDPADPTELTPAYISPQIEHLLGYSPDEWLSDPELWDRAIHPDDEETANEAAAASYATGAPLSVEYRMTARNGRVLWVREEATLFLDEDGAGKFWQGVYIDITDLKRAEIELQNALSREQDASERLRALDEMKNTFLQAVSHDLRTPLAAILGLALTLAREDVELDEPEVRDLAGRIAANAGKLDRMVADLLDLDRLSRGIMEPNLRETDVGALVRELVEQLGISASRAVVLDIGPVTIPVDPPKVERIVENLLVNALRHTPERAHVWVRTRAQDGGALISVEDDGPGVPAELREAVFEPFRQGPSPSSHSPGAGVGLALVARFAELHGGRAWIEEREGGGAAFRVFLPGT